MAFLPVLAAGTVVGSLFGRKKRRGGNAVMDPRLDGHLREQSEFNMNIARIGAELGAQQRNLESQQSQLANRAHEQGLQLAVIDSRTNSLQTNQQMMGSRMDQLRTDHHNFQTAISERSARMEELQKLFGEQQQLVNSEMNSRTLVLQEKLGETSTSLALVDNHVNDLQRDQDELTVSLRQQSERIDQWKSDQSKVNQLLAEHGARNEERQLCFMGEQRTFNDGMTKRTNALIDKLFDHSTKLEVMNARADHLQDGQHKLDLNLRQAGQTADERLRDQHRFNLSMTDQSSRIDERQNCFIANQKSHNEQLLLRTEGFRDKLGETSSKLEMINFRADILQSAQRQMEVDQLQIKELLKNVSNQLIEISVKMNSFDDRLEALQLDYKRVNEVVIKGEAKSELIEKRFDSFERSLSDLRSDFNQSQIQVAVMASRMAPM